MKNAVSRATKLFNLTKILGGSNTFDKTIFSVKLVIPKFGKKVVLLFVNPLLKDVLIAVAVKPMN